MKLQKLFFPKDVVIDRWSYRRQPGERDQMNDREREGGADDWPSLPASPGPALPGQPEKVSKKKKKIWRIS